MRALRVFWARLRGTFSGSAADDDMRAEFESHLAMHIDENIRRGMSPDEARRQALIAAGGMTVAAEAVRARRGLPWIESIASDFRYALRGAWHSKAYSLAVILTVALGIGANAAMFTIINAVLLRPLPYPNPDRLVSISLKNTDGDMGVVPGATYAEWVRSAKSVAISTSSGDDALFTFGDETERIDGRYATANYFSVLGVKPALGRVFSADEDIPNGPEVIVLSEQYWRRKLGGNKAVLGTTISVDNKPTTVIGVMPASFTTEHGAQFWTPYRLTPPKPGVTHYYFVTGRLRDGASIESATAELGALQAQVEASLPTKGESHMSPIVMSLHERRFGDTRKPLMLLFAAVGVLLLIACANLTNLSLARAIRREREFTVRLALGSGRWRLARHVLSETILLTMIGATVGLGLSAFAVRYLVALSPKSVARVEDIHIDPWVWLFTFAVATATGIIVGLVPAATAGGKSLAAALANGTPRAAGTVRQRWLRRVLVTAQLATALTLITGAGIVARTFWRVTSLDVGFRPERLLVASVTLPSKRYAPPSVQTFYADLLARVQREPTVSRAAIAAVPPISGASMSVSSTDSTGKTTPRVDVVDVGPGYLETIGAQLIAGRMIEASDREGAAKAAVITETTARALFPNADAVGRALPFHGLTVVGVVKNIRQWDLEAAPRPAMYVAAEQSGIRNRMVLVLRTSDEPERLEGAIRQAVHKMDPLLPTPTFTTMEQKLAEAAAPRRFTFVLFGLFGLLAGALAVIGLYGVLSYVVADRTREIGVRIALGADASQVRRLVVRQGMALVTIGVVIGVGISLLSAKSLESLVYQTSVYDPATFVASIVLLMVVAYLACVLPARRASKVDPILALRAD